MPHLLLARSGQRIHIYIYIYGDNIELVSLWCKHTEIVIKTSVQFGNIKNFIKQHFMNFINKQIHIRVKRINLENV